MHDGNPPLPSGRSVAFDDEAARYVRQLESIFVDVRGHGVQWTPDDVGRALRWCDAGVPLATARRVLSARVTAHRHLHGDARGVPYHLAAYEKAIQDALGGSMAVATIAAERRADPWRRVGGARGAVAIAGLDGALGVLDGALDDALDRAMRDVAARRREADAIAADADDPAVAAATRRAGLALEKVLSEATSLAELEAGVDKVRAETVRRVLEGIGPETAAAIARDVDAALPPTLGAGARRLRAARATERVLFERFGARVPTRDGWLPDPASAAR